MKRLTRKKPAISGRLFGMSGWLKTLANVPQHQRRKRVTLVVAHRRYGVAFGLNLPGSTGDQVDRNGNQSVIDEDTQQRSRVEGLTGLGSNRCAAVFLGGDAVGSAFVQGDKSGVFAAGGAVNVEGGAFLKRIDGNVISIAFDDAGTAGHQHRDNCRSKDLFHGVAPLVVLVGCFIHRGA